MTVKKYKPQVDKLFWLIFIPTTSLLIAVTALSLASLTALFITLGIDLFTIYFIISPLFGYVEIREKSIFIKFGFFMNREIEYLKIRAIEKKSQFCSDSMLSLKNSFEHINIKYNKFDLISVSVKDNQDLISELEARINKQY